MTVYYLAMRRILVLMLLCASAACAQDQVWTNYTPAVQDAGAGPGVELGVRFTSDVAGTITAIRFFKSPANTGTHTGSVWSSTGTLLASVTFTNETPSGWQQMNLATPVAIQANNPYFASYHTNVSHFAADQGYFIVPANNPPLHASISTYVYGNGGTFPAQTYNATNYAVDLVFTPSAPPVVTPPVCLPTTHSVTLSWTASTTAGVTYNIYRNGTLLVSGLTATTYTDSTMVSGKSYSYTSTSVAGGVESAQVSVTAFVAP